MERKSAAGTVRNSERSRQKFLDAVGNILMTKGYAGLKINAIAAEAGVDKKMIYKYFGGMEGLMDEYLRSRDFWSNVSAEPLKQRMDDAGEALAKTMLLAQFDHVATNKELQKILLWRLSEERNALRSMTEAQERNGELMFSLVADPRFDKNSETFRAVMALMVSGIYYLNMYAEVNGSIFCGVDLNTEHGRAKIREALETVVGMCYKSL